MTTSGIGYDGPASLVTAVICQRRQADINVNVDVNVVVRFRYGVGAMMM